MSLMADLTSTVTAAPLPSTAPELYVVVDRMKRDAVERDRDMMVISLVRQGKPEVLFPDLFNDTWKKPIVSNWIDGIAREFSEMIAPLPALNCSSKGMKNVADKKKAAIKNQVGTHMWTESNLKWHMIAHADRLLTYGFAPFLVEADYKCDAPRIVCEDPIGAYYTKDAQGNTVRYAKCWYETAQRLADLFPDYAHLILTKLDPYGNRVAIPGDEKVEVVRYMDADRTVMFLPARSNLIVAQVANPLDRPLVWIAERPGLFAQPAGQFRDVIWVQLAKQRMALLGLEIGVKSAGAPLAVPRDVVELAVGSDAVIQTDSPEKIRRVGIEVPNSVFQLDATLKEELMMGSRYPEGRASGIDASVVTGRGVQALMGSFDTQIATAQAILGLALKKVTELCFELDEKVWPRTKKRIFGTANGEPYDISYVPADLYDGDYVCDVTYGFAAGLNPSQAIVMMLQLRGDGLIDRDSVRRNLPFEINVDNMQRALDVEQTNDALKQGLFGLLQASGQVLAQGGDPLPWFRATHTILKGRMDGKPLEELFIKAFDPATLHPPQDDAGQPGGPQDPGAMPPGAPGGAQGDPNVAPGQGAAPIPGGQMSLQQLVAGLRGASGTPNMTADIRRRLPVGA
jgi:hypothetical protein